MTVTGKAARDRRVEERRRHALRKCRPSADGNDNHLLTIQVEELTAVSTPAWLEAAAVRDLVLAIGRVREWLNVDLPGPGFVRRVRDEAAVRRELRLFLITRPGQIRHRLGLVDRQHSEIHIRRRR